MNFFETNLGRTFFQVQVPKLISALTEIAEALRTPRPAVQVRTEIPKNFLADLYHGNLEPSYAEDTPEIAACSQQIMQLQKNSIRACPRTSGSKLKITAHCWTSGMSVRRNRLLPPAFAVP